MINLRAVDVYDSIPTVVTTFVSISGKISILILLLQLVYYINNKYLGISWTFGTITQNFFRLMLIFEQDFFCVSSVDCFSQSLVFLCPTLLSQGYNKVRGHLSIGGVPLSFAFGKPRPVFLWGLRRGGPSCLFSSSIFPFLSLSVRNFSTKPSPLVPEKIYSNADTCKLQTIKENKGKAGVYQWINLVNGKSYIGSSVNLGKRLRCYFNLDWLESEINKNKSKIYRALIKYGYSKFSLEILEYCEAEKCVEREQYYLDLLQPQYNILKVAGSLLGFNHSLKTKAKMSSVSKGRIRTAEHEAKLLEHLKRLNANPEFQAKRLEGLNRLHLSPEHKEHLARLHSSPEHKERLNHLNSIKSQKVSVLDSQTNETTVYSSISEAGRAIKVNQSTISMAFKSRGESTVWIKKKRYKITKLSK